MMYTLEGTRRQIHKIGVEAFIEWMLTATFSDEEKRQLENLHVMEDGIPILSAIYLLAR